MTREESIVRNLDHQKMVGIEIGPWYSPVAPKTQWKTVVVDFTDGDSLRDIAKNHNSELIRAAAYKIEDVDVVWQGKALDEACLAIVPSGFDFLIASHVMEHIPDLITFLRQVSRLLKDDGVVSLALPDKRYTFDYFKPLTMTNDVLEAFRRRDTRHTPGTLFQAQAYQSWNSGDGSWWRNSTLDIKLPAKLVNAHQAYLQAVKGISDPCEPYVDSHCWILTPSSFSLLILELHYLGYIDFSINHLEDGEGAEFFVQLGKRVLNLTEHELEERRLQLLLQIMREGASAAPPPESSTH